MLKQHSILGDLKYLPFLLKSQKTHLTVELSCLEVKRKKYKPKTTY